eukprot:3383982-Rhodomonas_salina.2
MIVWGPEQTGAANGRYEKKERTSHAVSRRCLARVAPAQVAMPTSARHNADVDGHTLLCHAAKQYRAQPQPALRSFRCVAFFWTLLTALSLARAFPCRCLSSRPSATTSWPLGSHAPSRAGPRLRRSIP